MKINKTLFITFTLFTAAISHDAASQGPSIKLLDYQTTVPAKWVSRPPTSTSRLAMFTVPATDSAMKKMSKSYEYQVFDGAGHGFLRGQEQNDGANLKAAQAAWPKTVAFFKAKLGG